MIIRELTDIQFDTYAKINNVTSIYQTSKYARVMQKNGYQTLLLGLFDNNTLVGASMILIENKNGFKYAYVPRGFVINFDNEKIVKDFTVQLKNYLKSKGIVAVKINPSIIKNKYNTDKKIIYSNNVAYTINNLKELGYHHFGYNNYFEGLKPRFEAILPLTKNKYQLFKNIKKKFRTKMRNAEKNGIVIHRGTKNSIEDLYNQTKHKYSRGKKFLTDIYNVFHDENQADIYYAKLNTKQYLETIGQEYEKQENICEKLDNLVLKNANNNFKNLTRKIIEDNKFAEYKEKLKYATKLLREHPEGIVIASIMVITNENTVTLFMDGYDTKYQTFNAKHLLLWKVIEKYAELGYTSFNLGGMTNILDSNKKYDGLNEFKLCFNPEIIEYIGDLELICNTPLYIMYRNSNKIKKLILK